MTETSNWCKAHHSCAFLQYFGFWPSSGSSLPSPEQLAKMARWSTSAIMAIQQGRNGYERFCAQQIRSKKTQLTFFGLRNVAAVRCLNNSYQAWKNGLQPAPVLACHDAKLMNASGFRQLGLLQRGMPHSIRFDLTVRTFPIHFSTLLSMVGVSTCTL